MKQFHIILVISLIVNLLGFSFAVYKYGPHLMSIISPLGNAESGNYWNRRVDQYGKLNKNLKDVTILLGDSIADEFNIEEYLPDYNIINRGIAGDTSSGLLLRLDDNVINAKPNNVFIMIGINDIRHNISVETICENYYKVLESLKVNSPNTKVYILSTLPIASICAEKRSTIDKYNIEVTKLNNELKMYCKANGIKFIDLTDKLSSKGYLSGRFTIDGVHLNYKAYSILANAIKDNYKF